VGGYPSSSPPPFAYVVDLTGRDSHRRERAQTAAALGARFLHIGIGDHPEAQDRLLAKLQSELLPFLTRAWASSAKILVHCEKGVSRSATIAVAFLMSLHSREALFDEGDVRRDGLAATALRYVKSRRRVHPNSGFREALRAYEVILASLPIDLT
jgi:predicted protein tyrosine phosphatase